jgi:hypothetical protein
MIHLKKKHKIKHFINYNYSRSHSHTFKSRRNWQKTVLISETFGYTEPLQLFDPVPNENYVVNLWNALDIRPDDPTSLDITCRGIWSDTGFD